MSLSNGIFVFIAIWCIIHILSYISTRKPSSILPTISQPRNSRTHTRVSLHFLHLKISTTAWNTYHVTLSSFIAKRGKHGLNALFKFTYDLGTVFGAVGIVVAVAALFWICTSSAWMLLQKMRATTSTSDIPHLMKRAMPGLETSKTLYVSSPYLEITPIIPGVTVPLSHLPIIFLAVFLSQIFHEFGHVLAAARESIPMVDAGASLTICIPIAFVTFSAAGLKTLMPQARSRITAAGPFHNLVLWVFLASVTRLGLFSLASFISGYRHVSDVGQVVISVDAGSPLYLHLSPGAIITKLDDIELGTKNTSIDMWTEYLTGVTQYISTGWCLERNGLKKSVSCCNPSSSTEESPFTCFISVDDDDYGCIDPLPIFAKLSSPRCIYTTDCPTDSICVVPDKRSQLLRLTVRPSLAGIEEETVVVWSGSRREVWEEVQVGNWLPRLWILPLWLPTLLDIFWQYLTMATLSLYFFNLLPLPHLDGTEQLLSILDFLFDRQQEPFIYDVEMLETEDALETTRMRQRWKQRLGKIISIMTMSAFICCIILGGMNILF